MMASTCSKMSVVFVYLTRQCGQQCRILLHVSAPVNVYRLMSVHQHLHLQQQWLAVRTPAIVVVL